MPNYIAVILIIIAFIATRVVAGQSHDTLIINITEIATPVIQVLLIFVIIKWVAEATLKAKIDLAKENPEKFKELYVDESVQDKDKLIKEIRKFDKIEKFNITKWLKSLISRDKEASTEQNFEVLIKTVEGLEQWYKIYSKNKKITKLESFVRPVM